MKRQPDLKRRRCPRGGTLAVHRRWDQPGWFVVCERCGTVAAGIPVAEARLRATAHLDGADNPPGSTRRPGAGTT